MTFCMNRSIKLTHTLFLLACFAVALPSYAQSNAPANASDGKIRDIDGVAAVVNTGYVTRKEIDDRMATIIKKGGGAAMPPAGAPRWRGLAVTNSSWCSMRCLIRGSRWTFPAR